jgi:hypothetical protein
LERIHKCIECQANWFVKIRRQKYRMCARARRPAGRATASQTSGTKDNRAVAKVNADRKIRRRYPRKSDDDQAMGKATWDLLPLALMRWFLLDLFSLRGARRQRLIVQEIATAQEM